MENIRERQAEQRIGRVYTRCANPIKAKITDERREPLPPQEIHPTGNRLWLLIE